MATVFLYNALLDALFPPRCVGCASSGALLCHDCIADVTPPLPTCAVCGTPSKNAAVCFSCQNYFAFDALFVGAMYHAHPALKKAISQFKYKSTKDLATTLSSLLLAAVPATFTADAVCPVPLFSSRFRSRGFNQAALMAREVSAARSIPFMDLLVRTRDTGHQAHHTRGERLVALSNAFTARENIYIKHVLLIDDVSATGATLSACASALKKAGAVRVSAAVLARGG